MNDNNKKQMQSIMLEAINLNEDSAIAQKAKAMGLHYVGFGRWSDGRTTYKSDGINLVPMDKSKNKESTKQDWLTKFINHSNKNAESYKSAKKLLEYMVKALPDPEKWGKEWGTKEKLQEILLKCVPKFNDTVITILKDQKFRTTLVKAYLAKFSEPIEEKSKEPSMNQTAKPMTPPQQAQIPNVNQNAQPTQ